MMMLSWLVMQPAPTVPAPAPAAAPTVVSTRVRGVASCGGSVCSRSTWVSVVLCWGRVVLRQAADVASLVMHSAIAVSAYDVWLTLCVGRDVATTG
jgi:hypothetical protein